MGVKEAVRAERKSVVMCVRSSAVKPAFFKRSVKADTILYLAKREGLAPGNIPKGSLPHKPKELIKNLCRHFRQTHVKKNMVRARAPRSSACTVFRALTASMASAPAQGVSDDGTPAHARALVWSFLCTAAQSREHARGTAAPHLEVALEKEPRDQWRRRARLCLAQRHPIERACGRLLPGGLAQRDVRARCRDPCCRRDRRVRRDDVCEHAQMKHAMLRVKQEWRR
jgi:hypothetical protein